jgi:hypothetical protein
MKQRWHLRGGWHPINTPYGRCWLPAWLFSFSWRPPLSIYIRILGLWLHVYHCKTMIRCDECGWIDSRYIGHACLDPTPAEVTAAMGSFR